MKKLFLLLTVLYGLLCNAQNYQCLQGGVKRYFTNSNGYLRGMRIDSIRTSGTDIIYYPFHTARGNYIDIVTTPLDANGGSWLGKKVIQHNDGTFLFDNIWNDTIIVKTQARTGDSWVFYNDSSTKYYKATITAQDTMTVFGSIDSIKTVEISAYTGSVHDIADSLNNFIIVLSKNHGFIKVFDLYTFPYHRSDTVFGTGQDYYLDYLISDSKRCMSPFLTTIYNNLNFNAIDLANPTYAQIYDWNVGDLFENWVFRADISNDGTYPYGYFLDSITTKTTTAGGVQYNFTGWSATMHFSPPWIVLSSSFNPTIPYPYDTSINTGMLTFTNELLIDTTVMPEENTQQWLLYYFRNDTSACHNGDMYQFIDGNAFHPSICFEGAPLIRTYKTGLGLLNSNWNILGGSPPRIQDTTLIYFVKNGSPCGHYTYPAPINYITGINDINNLVFTIFPNPATKEITIQTNSTKTCTVSLENMLGEIILRQKIKSQQDNLDLTGIYSGIYNIIISDDSGKKYNQRLIISY